MTLSSSVATRHSSSKLTSSSSSSLSKAQASLALHSLERRFGSALAAPLLLRAGVEGSFAGLTANVPGARIDD